MVGEKVTLDVEFIHKYRKKNALGRIELYKALGVQHMTGKRILDGCPVRLSVAKKVAGKIGVKVQRLIKTWADKAEMVTSNDC